MILMRIFVNKGSLDGSMKPVDSDVDSLGLYGDGEAGKFNEEGSFIGQVTHAVVDLEANSVAVKFGFCTRHGV